MKRTFIIITIFIILLIASVVYFLRGNSGYQSIYFVPENASVIFESKDPVKAWDQIVHSNIWEHYKTNEFFAELNKDIESYDSLINSNKMLLNLVGSKTVLLAQVPIGNNKYDFLYIVDVGNFKEKLQLFLF
ncbi:MAG: hypothetical protein JEZ09_14990 [Salinivirgaceae bacterium]|nr:hypothetical protein [Salinivirgaceae bacterium]